MFADRFFLYLVGSRDVDASIVTHLFRAPRVACPEAPVVRSCLDCLRDVTVSVVLVRDARPSRVEFCTQ